VPGLRVPGLRVPGLRVPRPRLPGRWLARRWLPEAAVGLLAGVIVLGPALAPGFVLSYDMVFVPDPPATPAMFGLTGGFPRPVPSDAVVAALAVPLPAQVVQKLVLLVIFVLGACGAARLVPSRRPAPRLAAAAFYVWNPYVAERLVLGHWALLLGYAGLPWAVRAAASAGERGGAARLARTLVPAAVGGFAAMDISALVVLSVVACRPGRRRAAPRAVAVIVGLSLPWLVPALWQAAAGGAGGAGGDPVSVDLFAARADTPFGALGSLVSLGGIWNREVVPPGLGAWPGAAARLALSLIAIVFFARRVRRRRAEEPWLGGLAVAGGAGLAAAALGVTAPGRAALRWLIATWPASGVLRDAQVWVAPLALVEAAGAAAAVAAILGWRPRPTGEAAALAWLVAAAPVVLLPTLAWGADGRLAAVRYPADWAAARRIIGRDPVPGAVLSLPWAAHRPVSWNAGRTTLDPLPRAVPRRVVWNDGLRVGGRALAPEDPAARAAGALLGTPGSLTGPLRRAGYRFVVVANGGGPETARSAPGAENENAFEQRLSGAVRLLDGPALAVYLIPSPARFSEVGAPPAAPVLTGDLIALLLILWSFAGSGSTLLALRTRE
jgi:hypothetical protein